MAIFPQVAALILKEHKHRPIIGDIVLIGRQTVLLSEEAALELMAEEDIPPRSKYLREIDHTTIGSDFGPYITDRSFFSMFSPARVLALDVSDYEGAEIISDLNKPLSDRYHAVADFIFNGSCLDNLFDPAMAMRSLSKMLRPEGRIMHLEHGSPIQDAFLCYSPEWFFSFYAINNYSDCQTLVCTFPNGLQQAWTLERWNPYRESKAAGASLGIGDFLNVVIAQKDSTSTDDLSPIQSHYRLLQNDANEKIYQEKAVEFDKNAREYVAMPIQLRGQFAVRHDIAPIDIKPSEDIPLSMWRRAGRFGLQVLGTLSPKLADSVRKAHRAAYARLYSSRS